MEQEITTLLASAATRRYWGRAPQKNTARPYIVLTRVSGIHGYHMQGGDGVVGVRLQIDCYADTYTDAKVTADAVELALSGYRGGSIQAVFIDSRRDLSGIEGGDPKELYRQSIDVFVHHTSA